MCQTIWALRGGLNVHKRDETALPNLFEEHLVGQAVGVAARGFLAQDRRRRDDPLLCHLFWSARRVAFCGVHAHVCVPHVTIIRFPESTLPRAPPAIRAARDSPDDGPGSSVVLSRVLVLVSLLLEGVFFVARCSRLFPTFVVR